MTAAPLILVQHVWVAAEEAEQAERRFLAHDGPHSAGDKQALHICGERLGKLLAANCSRGKHA